MQTRVADILRAYGLLSPAQRILAACSGGTDSLVLLDILDCLHRAGGAQVLCAHYEHGIRGAESRADAEYVAAFCRGRRIPFVCAAGDVPAYARMHQMSLETAARTCRYAFLRCVQAEANCACIALAHHADDLAETVLMRILRGTGTTGLAAMRVYDDTLLRPLLGTGRDEIEAYVCGRGLMPRHDATNDCMDARRNRIRHVLMPMLRAQYNPAVRDALTRLSVLAGEEDDLLSHFAADALGRAACAEGLSAAVMRALHPALQRRVLRLFWRRETGLVQDFSYLHEERLRALIGGRAAAACELPRGWRAVLRYGVLMLQQTQKQSERKQNRDEEILLPLDAEYGIINFQGMRFCIRRHTEMTAGDRQRMTARHAVYAARSALPPLVLRTRRAGDYMNLPMGRKKIKNIMIDDKMPRTERDSLPLIACAGTHEIFWMAGGRRSTIAPVLPSSGDIISIDCMKETIAE